MGALDDRPGRPSSSRYRRITAWGLVLLALAALGGVGYMAGGANTAYTYGYQYCTGPYIYCSTTKTTTKKRKPKCHVPDVVGKKRGRATRAIVHAHCKVGKVRKKWSRTFEKNHVISQAPPAGTVLPYHGRVNLVISLGKCRND